MAGLSATGFVKKTLDEIRAEIEAALRVVLGQNVDLDPDSDLGELVGIIAEREADLWDQLERVYQAGHLDGASGVPLDRTVALSGIARLPATYSTVTWNLTGTPGATIPAGVEAIVDGGAAFVSTAAVTLNGGGTGSVAARATTTGPIAAVAGSTWSITTPTAGLTSIATAADAEPGRNVETDQELRVRQIDSFSGDGSSAKALRAELLRVADVTEVLVIENRSLAADADGRPPKSYEVVIEGGLDATIAQTVWDRGPGGIESHGSTTVVVNDGAGDPQTVKFSRFTPVPVYVKVEISGDNTLPADAVTRARDAVLQRYVPQLTGGVDVFPVRIKGAILGAGIPGITELTVLVGLADPPIASASLTIARTARAVITSATLNVVRV